MTTTQTTETTNTGLGALAALCGLNLTTTTYVGPVLHEAYIQSLAGTPEARIDAFGAVSAAYSVSVDQVMAWHNRRVWAEEEAA